MITNLNETQNYFWKSYFSFCFEGERHGVAVVRQRLGFRWVCVELEDEGRHQSRNGLVRRDLDRGLMLAGRALASPFLSI